MNTLAPSYDTTAATSATQLRAAWAAEPSQGEMGLERRQWERKKTHFQAHARRGAGFFVAAEVWDVSERGLFLRFMETWVRVEPGDRVDVHLMPGNFARVKARGIVRWVGTSQQHGIEGIGIELDEPIEGMAY